MILFGTLGILCGMLGALFVHSVASLVKLIRQLQVIVADAPPKWQRRGSVVHCSTGSAPLAHAHEGGQGGRANGHGGGGNGGGGSVPGGCSSSSLSTSSDGRMDERNERNFHNPMSPSSRDASPVVPRAVPPMVSRTGDSFRGSMVGLGGSLFHPVGSSSVHGAEPGFNQLPWHARVREHLTRRCTWRGVMSAMLSRYGYTLMVSFTSSMLTFPFGFFRTDAEEV